MELYNVTMKEGAEVAIRSVMKKFGVSHAKAKNLVANALIYSHVVSHIQEIAGYLLQDEINLAPASYLPGKLEKEK